MPTYSPAQAVDRSGFSIDTLRYYERIGLLRDIARDGSGHRVFTDAHLSTLTILRCLRDTGMPIAQMQRYADLSATDGSLQARLDLLEEHDADVTRQIAELGRWQKHLQEKIAYYRAELRTKSD
jgi:DNA-binding transcriptional MerR regulator